MTLWSILVIVLTVVFCNQTALCRAWVPYRVVDGSECSSIVIPARICSVAKVPEKISTTVIGPREDVISRSQFHVCAVVKSRREPATPLSYRAIHRLAGHFGRVIMESHLSLFETSCNFDLARNNRIRPRLEAAILGQRVKCPRKCT